MDHARTLQEAMLPHYMQLALGVPVTFPDGMTYTYRQLAKECGNGIELTFAQFVDFCDGYMHKPRQLTLL